MNNCWLKILLVIFLLLNLSQLQAQKQKISFSANLLEYDEDLRPGVEHYTGNVNFWHGKMHGTCQVADHYRDENKLHAYGGRVHVRINDSVTLQGNEVIYDGNAKIVKIYVNVILTDQTATLTTDTLTYDLDQDVGYYLTGGKIVSEDNVLTSRKGYYYTKTDIAYLNKKVHLVNNTYTVDCESAKFNSRTEYVYFTSRTHLYSDDSEVFTDGGWYDTQNDITNLVGNAELYNENQYLSGDSLYYDKPRGFGRGWRNVRLVDSVKNFTVDGNYMEYYDGHYAIVTDSSMLTLIEDGDSLFLHADTLHILFDSLQNPTHMFAYNHAKFYRHDLQGACDSLVYLVEDSVIVMNYNPVVWSGENQLTGDTIRFVMLDSVHMDVHLIRSAFIASSLFDDTEFNQIKGLSIVGHIVRRQLQRVDVVGNAECLYYIQEQDSALIGINSAITSEMTIFLKDSEIRDIRFYNNPDGNLFPDKDLNDKDRRLKDFRWLHQYRPQNVEGIFVLPVEREIDDISLKD